MANIDLNSNSNLSWHARILVWLQKIKYGRPLEPVLAWLRLPKVFFKFYSLWKSLSRKSSPFTKEFRALVSVFVSMQNSCKYCIDYHSSLILSSPTYKAKLNRLASYKTSELFDAREKIALEYTELVSITPVVIPKELFKDLKKYFNEVEIIELTALISFQNMSSKFNSALDVAAYGFCKIPKDNK